MNVRTETTMRWSAVLTPAEWERVPIEVRTALRGLVQYKNLHGGNIEIYTREPGKGSHAEALLRSVFPPKLDGVRIKPKDPDLPGHFPLTIRCEAQGSVEKWKAFMGQHFIAYAASWGIMMKSGTKEIGLYVPRRNRWDLLWWGYPGFLGQLVGVAMRAAHLLPDSEGFIYAQPKADSMTAQGVIAGVEEAFMIFQHPAIAQRIVPEDDPSEGTADMTLVLTNGRKFKLVVTEIPE